MVQKKFLKMVGIEKSDYCGYTITKSELGNMISGGQAIGVGVKFLNRYIYIMQQDLIMDLECRS